MKIRREKYEEETKYLNEKSGVTTLIATISPSNATNQMITWESSDATVATVDNNGVVTAKNLGNATITVKKKIIIIIGASQVTRMKKYISSHESNIYQYFTSNETLKFIEKSGSAFDYQVNAGWTSALNFIHKYASSKDYIDFYVYFPIAGNGIKPLTCDKITTSNSTIDTYMKNYSLKIQSLKNEGYHAKAYVVSVQPVMTQVAEANLCKATYRSNLKYYTFNKVTRTLLANYPDLIYVETFQQIMNVSDNEKTFTYKVPYQTTDGVHWDETTTHSYMHYMLDPNHEI